MSCIDTHSHIYGEEFDADREEVIARAKAAGVSHIFLPNINEGSVRPMLNLCERHPDFCYPMIGLHPEDVTEKWPSVLAAMEQRLQKTGHPFIGIGEVGLDFYWDNTHAEAQQTVFKTQAKWALKYNLPLMIHTRAAHREMVNCLRNVIAEAKQESCQTNQSNLHSHSVQTSELTSTTSRLAGVFHCFGGSEEEAAELLTFEHFMLGIGGIVTFKKSSLPEILRHAVPIERIVLETDSPYLAPVPHRGERNESAYVMDVAEKVANIYQVSVAKVCEITSRNAMQIFSRASQPGIFEGKTHKNDPH